MSWHNFFEVSTALVGALGATILTILWGLLRETRRDLVHLKEQLPLTYTLKSDFHRETDELKRLLDDIKRGQLEGFQRLYEKLDQKVDKG